MAETKKMMKYTTKDKIYRFPKDELENIQKIAKNEKISFAIAVENWLIKNGLENTIEKVNAEVGVKKATPEKKKSKPRTVVYTDEELKIVEIITTALKNAEVGEISKPKPKTINVVSGGVEYSINIVKHRPPKA